MSMLNDKNRTKKFKMPLRDGLTNKIYQVDVTPEEYITAAMSI